MSANDRQVGGTHYGEDYQHWDFAIDTRMPYIEGQITKYVDRHGRKNGRQDLEKAKHFAEKLFEAATTGAVAPTSIYYGQAHIGRYLRARSRYSLNEQTAVTSIVLWAKPSEIATAIRAIERAIDEFYPVAATATATVDLLPPHSG